MLAQLDLRDIKIHNNESERIDWLKESIFPLSSPTKDSCGNTIQLWSVPQSKLAATIQSPNGSLQFAYKIKNGLNREEDPITLHNRLMQAPFNSQIEFVTNEDGSLIIWPRLIAAGWRDAIPKSSSDLSGLTRLARSRTQEQMCGWFYTNGFKVMKSHAADQTRIEMHFRSGENLGTYRADDHQTIQNLLRQGGYIKAVHCPASSDGKFDGRGLVFQHPKDQSHSTFNVDFTKELDGGHWKAEKEGGYHIDVKSSKYNGKVKISTNETYAANYQATKEGKKLPFVLKSSTKHFEQTVQQTKLTKSYSSTNPQNPVPAKGRASGDIGGVACSVDYIQGLFDGFDQNKKHYFYFPAKENAIPFSDKELKQILREIAIGIYVHNTVPFFSLHFNQDGEMFPVIHPAYENTLVGRVIALLDYTMKGYLNGGVFNDSFTDAWAKNPNWNAKKGSAMEQLINFTDYCREQMSGVDKIYLSTEDLGALQSAMSERDPNEPEIFSDYTQFTNSFRIISKQNGWPKHDNILVIDSDFDVFYTILPNANYRKALEAYYSEKGHYPKSYLKLKDMFEEMKDRIHDHMAKFPLRKEYFSMLGFIGYFASYFSTLKKHRKVPILPPFEKVSVTTPALFPHLPTKVKETISLDLNLHQMLKSLAANEIIILQRFVDNQPETKTLLEEILKTHMVAQIKKNLSTSKQVAFQNALNQEQLNQLFNKWVDDLLTVINSIPDHLNAQKEEVLSIKEQLINGTYTLSESDVQEIKMITKLHSDLNAKKTEFQNELRSYPRYQYNKPLICISPAYRIELEKGIEKIDEILSVSPEATFRKAKLEHINKATQSIDEKQRNIQGVVLELIPDKIQHMAEFTASFLSLKEDMTQENQTKGKRMLGGCGFHLQEAHVMPSLIAKQVQLNHISKLVNMDSEKWKLLSDETGMGALFTLSYENTPVGIPDDFRWLENSLRKDPTFWSNWEEALLCLSKPTPQNLINLGQHFSLTKTDNKERTLLHLAAQGENPAFIPELRKRGISLFAEDNQGNLPIHYAAAGGKCLAALIEADKTTVHVENKNKETPLHVAIQNGILENVQKLAAAGAKNSYSHTGYNTLHVALHHGYEETALFLIENKIVNASDINSLAEEGGTPLMMACELKLLNLVQRLTKEGANISLARKDGVTALEIAIQMDAIPIIECLLKLGKPSDQALETLAKEGSVQACNAFSKIPEFSGYRNVWNDSLFQMAIRAGNIKPFAPHLSKLPSDVYEEKNKRGETIRQLAIQGGYLSILPQLTSKKRLNADEISSLLIHPFNPALKDLIQDANLTPEEKESLIKRAAEVGNIGAIPYFLKPGDSLKEDLIDLLVKGDAIYLLRRYFGTKLSVSQYDSLIGHAAANKSLKVLRYLVNKAKDSNITFNPAWIRSAVDTDEVEALKIVLTLSQDPKNFLIDSKEHPLHHAASRGCKKIVDYLITLGLPVDALDQHERSPLFYALKADEQSAVKLLLKKQAKIGPPELYQAASSSSKIWSLVLSAAPSLDLPSIKGETPLTIAIQERNTKAIANLLKAGAHPNLPGLQGWTPTCLAASKGDYESLSLLLSHGVDKEPYQDKNALHWACENGHPHLIKLLISHGFEADQKATDLAINHNAVLYELGQAVGDYKTTLDLFLSQLEMISYMTTPSLSELIATIKTLPLNAPISYKQSAAPPLLCLLNKLSELKKFSKEIPWFKDIVQALVIEEIPQLIQLGLNPNATDSYGRSMARSLLLLEQNPKSIPHIDLTLGDKNGVTPLHIGDQLEDVALFDEAYQGINAVDKTGETPLFYALKAERTDQIGQLLHQKADPNHRNIANMTPLSLAVAKGSLHSVQLLVEGGAKVNQPFTGDQLTPLLLATSLENLEITRYLLDKGADPRIANRKGEYPIHCAARSGNIALFRLLAERGSPLEFATNQGILPVHFAALKGHLQILKELNLRGASLNAPTQLNLKKPEDPVRTALYYAAGKGELEVMRFLIEAIGLPKEEQEMEGPSVFAAAAASTSSLSSLRKYRLSENTELLKQAALSSIAHDNPDSLKTVLEWGIIPNANLDHGMQLLHYASMHGATQTTAVLIEQGANPLTRNNGGETALEMAAKNNFFEQFELILEYCCYMPEFEIDAKNNRGETLAHLAAKAGNVSHLAALFSAGATFDEMNVQFATPLDEVLRIHAYIEDKPLKQKLFEAARFLFICGAEMDEEHKNHPLIQAFKSKVHEEDTPLQKAEKLQDKTALHLFDKTDDSLNNY